MNAHSQSKGLGDCPLREEATLYERDATYDLAGSDWVSLSFPCLECGQWTMPLQRHTYNDCKIFKSYNNEVAEK